MARRSSRPDGAREPIDDSILRRFVFNQADVLRAMASGPAARHAADDDVVMVDSGGPVPTTTWRCSVAPDDRRRPGSPSSRRRDRRRATRRSCASRRCVSRVACSAAPDVRRARAAGHRRRARRRRRCSDVTTVDDLRRRSSVATIDGYPTTEALGLGRGHPLVTDDAARRTRSSPDSQARLDARCAGCRGRGRAVVDAHGVATRASPPSAARPTTADGRRRASGRRRGPREPARRRERRVAFTSDDAAGLRPHGSCRCSLHPLGAPAGAWQAGGLDEREQPMQLGMIGLGRMGAEPRAPAHARRPRVRRLRRERRTRSTALAGEGADRRVLPRGVRGEARASRGRCGSWCPPAFVDDTIEKLVEHLEPGDIIIDGGNSLLPRRHPARGRARAEGHPLRRRAARAAACSASSAASA